MTNTNNDDGNNDNGNNDNGQSKQCADMAALSECIAEANAAQIDKTEAGDPSVDSLRNRMLKLLDTAHLYQQESRRFSERSRPMASHMRLNSISSEMVALAAGLEDELSRDPWNQGFVHRCLTVRSEPVWDRNVLFNIYFPR